VLLLAACPIAAAPAVVLTEDFDSPGDGTLPARWTSDGGRWAVVEGRLRGSPADGSTETTLLLHLPDPAPRHVAVEADVAFVTTREPTRWFALLVRDGGPSSPGVQLSVRQDAKRANGLEIAAKKPLPDAGWRVLQTARAPNSFEPGTTHRVRLEARGAWIRGFFDGRKILQSPRADEFTPVGRVGFRINGATVDIDNVKVLALDPPEPSQLHCPRARPLVIAHRGLSWRAPENTLAAYRLAMEAKADMAECDVRLTADRVPILLHDQKLDRTTGTKGNVNDVTLADLRKLDAGKWKSAAFIGEHVPTLAETLDLVKGRLRLVIEIKEHGIEKEVLEALRAAGVTPDAVMIFSFYRDVVQAIAALEPMVPTTWLIGDLPHDAEGRRAVLRDALQARASALGLPKERVDPDFLILARQCGFPVFVWTVNEPIDMRFLIRIGVDGIITDHPDVLIDVLNAPEKP